MAKRNRVQSSRTQATKRPTKPAQRSAHPPAHGKSGRGRSAQRARNSKAPRQSRIPAKQLSASQREAKVRALNALNRVRKGKSKSLSAAAKAEGTSVKTIRQFLPAAIIRDRGGRIRVKAADPYGAPVEIITAEGPIVVFARNSRERELAGRHRADAIEVLKGEVPESVLTRYRGKTVGGQELISDFATLSTLEKAGVLDQLQGVYVSPEVSA